MERFYYAKNDIVYNKTLQTIAHSVEYSIITSQTVDGYISISQTVDGLISIGKTVNGYISIGQTVDGYISIGQAVDGYISIGQTVDGYIGIEGFELTSLVVITRIAVNPTTIRSRRSHNV
jgi:hypothetical protein